MPTEGNPVPGIPRYCSPLGYRAGGGQRRRHGRLATTRQRATLTGTHIRARLATALPLTRRGGDRHGPGATKGHGGGRPQPHTAAGREAWPTARGSALAPGTER
jgi:hypothetical protein